MHAYIHTYTVRTAAAGVASSTFLGSLGLTSASDRYTEDNFSPEESTECGKVCEHLLMVGHVYHILDLHRRGTCSTFGSSRKGVEVMYMDAHARILCFAMAQTRHNTSHSHARATHRWGGGPHSLPWAPWAPVVRQEGSVMRQLMCSNLG
jgi:hypothetical protein